MSPCYLSSWLIVADDTKPDNADCWPCWASRPIRSRLADTSDIDPQSRRSATASGEANPHAGHRWSRLSLRMRRGK